jgi:hypothetical protein
MSNLASRRVINPWTLGDEFGLFRRWRFRKGARYPSVRPAGLDRESGRVVIVDAMQHALMMDVHFRRGGGSAVLGVPSIEFTDAHEFNSPY